MNVIVEDTMNGTTETTDGRRLRWRPRPRQAGVLAVTAGLVLLTAACSSSSPGAASSPSASSSGSVPPAVAFAECIRSHGVANFPDPGADGKEPSGTKQAVNGNPRYPAALDACRHLIPSGSQSTGTGANDLTEAGAVSLAGCMRTHGFPTFPDPTTNSSGQPVFNPQAAGVNAHSPQVQTALHTCLSLLHLTGTPQVVSGV
jgi:hypothetical protein